MDERQHAGYRAVLLRKQVVRPLAKPAFDHVTPASAVEERAVGGGDHIAIPGHFLGRGQFANDSSHISGKSPRMLLAPLALALTAFRTI
jgi:hypothetical protein